MDPAAVLVKEEAVAQVHPARDTPAVMGQMRVPLVITTTMNKVVAVVALVAPAVMVRLVVAQEMVVMAVME